MTISSIKENSSRFLSAAKGYTRVLWERSAGIQVNVTGTALEKLGNAEDVLLHMPMIRKKGDETDVFGKGAPTIYINGIEMRSGGCLQNRLKNKIKYENVNMCSAFALNNNIVLKELLFINYKNRLKENTKYFGQIILGLIVGSLLQLVLPFLTQSIVDVGIKNQDISFIWLILLGQLMLTFSRTAIDNNKTYEFITSMQEIKLQDCEQRRRWEWEDTQVDLFNVQMKSLKLQQTQEAGSILINEVKNIVITVVAAGIQVMPCCFTFVTGAWCLSVKKRHLLQR